MTHRATINELRAKSDALASAQEYIAAQADLIDALKRQADAQDAFITELQLEILQLKGGDA